MRRSLRFFSSCSSSSVISVRSFVQQKVLARHAAQDHALHPVQVVKTVAGGLAHRAQQRFPWILPHQAQQLPQGKGDELAAPLLQPRDRKSTRLNSSHSSSSYAVFCLKKKK